ncbi:MAG: NAD(+) synthase [Alistipes sp.]|nr:NAD(+) synthase [Alistipes sp.]
MYRFGYVKTAIAVPRTAVADCRLNARRIIAAIDRAEQRFADIVLFPELSVTGYTCDDLFTQPALLQASNEALAEIVAATAGLRLAAIVGIPAAVGGRLYNCAAVIADGRLLGLVPKSHIAGYGEFYETRRFASGAGIAGRSIDIAGFCGVPFGTDLLFRRGEAVFAAELCEDLWTPVPPSSVAACAGATIIFNLSASPEIVGKYDYLQRLVEVQSGRTVSAYVYASSGFGESSTDLVFAGSSLIAECGTMVARGERFAADGSMTVADVDVSRIEAARRANPGFGEHVSVGCYRQIEVPVIRAMVPAEEIPLDRYVDPMPFVPSDDGELSRRCEDILSVQAAGLMQRLAATGCRRAVIGISGGLDSTLALLVTLRAFDRLGLERTGITAITMPGFGTTGRTYDNAVALIRESGATLREIPIRRACEVHFADIGLPEDDRSVSYENAQARERTQILMDVANMESAMVIGTGDLSEMALGWATYNGDHMSMYGVNCSVPKTLVRHLVSYIARKQNSQRMRDILDDIVDTPVSPELLPADENGMIAQKTEDIVGPYELHDFFLYNFISRRFEPAKIEFLARHAFQGRYDESMIRRTLQMFLRRFFSQQFKRSAMPDGPKTGSVSLSPRGDWKMPSDASAAAWLAQLKD